MGTQVETAAAVGVDPVTASIIQHGLDAAADQMLVTLKRTAFSPIIYDILDGGGAFYDRNFRMLSQIQTLPLFTGSLGLCVESVATHYEEHGGLQDGDVLVVNDPFLTGTHQWDVAVIVPGFLDGELVAYAAIKAHQLDVGALAPFVTESTDVFQEGTICPGVKLYKAGQLDDDLYRTMLANTRLPESAAGDLGAQAGACRAGLRALLELIERYGLEQFDAAVEVILDAGEAKMRERLSALPPGRYTSTMVHEHNGLEQVMLPFEVAIEIDDDGITIDLTDAPDAQPGPVNSPRVGVVSAIRCAMMALAIDDGRANEGYFRPLKLENTPRLDVRCAAPVAVRARELPDVHPDRGDQRGDRPGDSRKAARRLRHVRVARPLGAQPARHVLGGLDQRRRRRARGRRLRRRRRPADAGRLLRHPRRLVGGLGVEDADGGRAGGLRL